MPKSPKKKAKQSKKAAVDEAPRAAKGRLVAVEGTRGRELVEEAERLGKVCTRGDDAAGWSLWDASNTFFELRMGKVKRAGVPPRTLLLLYASDLLFRLRWEIEPAVQDGMTVFAAPYVESAFAFGLAAGLPADWLQELFGFAPKPDLLLRLKEKKSKNGKEKTLDGFVEFCCKTLAASDPEFDLPRVRASILKHLEGLEAKGQAETIGKKLPKMLQKK